MASRGDNRQSRSGRLWDRSRRVQESSVRHFKFEIPSVKRLIRRNNFRRSLDDRRHLVPGRCQSSADVHRQPHSRPPEIPQARFRPPKARGKARLETNGMRYRLQLRHFARHARPAHRFDGQHRSGHQRISRVTGDRKRVRRFIWSCPRCTACLRRHVELRTQFHHGNVAAEVASPCSSRSNAPIRFWNCDDRKIRSKAISLRRGRADVPKHEGGHLACCDIDDPARHGAVRRGHSAGRVGPARSRRNRLAVIAPSWCSPIT